MSKELNAQYTTGKTVYFRAKSGGQFLNVITLALEDYVAGNIDHYAILAAEVGNTGLYEADMPEGPAGRYDIFPFEKTGANYAESDPPCAGGFTITWNGTAVVDEAPVGYDSTLALITVTEAKQYLKITGSDDDTILVALIHAVSSWIQNYLDRDLVSKAHTEYYSGDGSEELMLRQYPISAVTSIHVDALRAWGSDAAITVSSDVMLQKEQGILKAWNNLGYWSPGDSNIKVVYTAGYTTGTSGNLPAAVKLATFRLLDLHFRQGYTHRKLDMISDNVGDINTSYRSGDFPAEVKAILDPYRRMVSTPQFAYAD